MGVSCKCLEYLLRDCVFDLKFFDLLDEIFFGVLEMNFVYALAAF